MHGNNASSIFSFGWQFEKVRHIVTVKISILLNRNQTKYCYEMLKNPTVANKIILVGSTTLLNTGTSVVPSLIRQSTNQVFPQIDNDNEQIAGAAYCTSIALEVSKIKTYSYFFFFKLVLFK